MYCDKCPHRAEIEEALRPCQWCADAKARSGACENCATLAKVRIALEPCAECEAGKLHHQVCMDRGGAAAAALQFAAQQSYRPTEGATELPPDVEDAMRKMLAVLFQFDPLRLLLIQHVAHGRNVSTFRETLADLKDRLNNRYDLSDGSRTFRQVAHMWKKSIVAQFPEIADMFDAVANANAGTRR